MPIQPISTLRATRIGEAQARVEAAAQQLEQAKSDLVRAKAELDNATTEEEKTTAKTKVASAQKQVADAESAADFEQLQLNRLLECETSMWVSIGQYVIFGSFALIVLLFLMAGITYYGLLPALSVIATSRGLITFLVAVVTVTIALILVLSSIVSDSPDFAQRFRNGKEILVALIGVLGTIIGFYFGQTSDEVKQLEVGPVYTNVTPTAKGETITLVGFAHGGKLPYSYRVDFLPKSIPSINQKVSRNGLISESVSTAVEKDTEASFEISVTDSEGRKATYDSIKAGDKVELKKKQAASALRHGFFESLAGH